MSKLRRIAHCPGPFIDGYYHCAEPLLSMHRQPSNRIPVVGQESGGAYLFALWLGGPRAIKVGRLGEIGFAAGWYLYTGSAHGPGGLRARLARHLRRLGDAKRAHWHIDPVRERAAWGGAWGLASADRHECAWAVQLRGLPGAQTATHGLGASDCGCAGHLVHLPHLPEDAWFEAALGAGRISMGGGEPDELAACLVSENEEGREATAPALGRMGRPALEPLGGLLGSSDPDLRWWATRALAEAGNVAAGLLLGALADRNPDVRACAALALGQVRAAAATQALAARLADESTLVAGIAADALSMIGPTAVPALAQMLHDPRASARLLAVRALERCGGRDAIGSLLGAIDDESYLVGLYAREAIDTLGAGMVYFRA